MKSLVFLNSHPIQYFTPLYQAIERTGEFNLEILYCSDESIRGALDEGFGVNVKWDIPLLEGYQSLFLKNYSPKKSIHNGFLGLMNFGIIGYLFKKQKSIIVVHGWGYLTHVLTIIFGRILGHTICLRAETPLNQESLKKGLLQSVKRVWLSFLFLFAKKFLYIGKQNKLFYESFGIKENNLIFCPYCVDNTRFQEIASCISQEKAKISLGINPSKKIILYSGKYIPKKRPLDLLAALALLQSQSDYFLIMVGDGSLRREMEIFIENNGLSDKVLLTGFINQQKIGLYYAACDVFVMCSDVGETWGLSVNEAMNFAKPVIVSSICGCSDDLVRNGENGFTFTVGDVSALATHIKTVLSDCEIQIKMSKNSIEIIKQFFYTEIITAINTFI